MMMGSYPCCNKPLFIPMPEKTPAYDLEECDCGKKVWHVFSKIEPMSYLEKDFLEKYDVDFENKIVNKKVKVKQ